MKPHITLLTPVGINNFTGEIFKCFTHGDSLSFTFNFDKNIDVSDWIVTITFSSAFWCSDTECTGDTFLSKKAPVNIDIPLIDEENSIFKGVVSNSDTTSIPCGLVYASARYTDGNDISKIIDMCQLEVYPNIYPM